ncbi:Isopentenyldiphosphate isomerase [Sinomicrobium oceani]|uniref:Isopentenyldiphosphate isomerase n=1 Tax=Sinomicrobium oceani TaxID=1150368 RepID=A0A1K1RP15_9FLAO|nr:NUDIX domain-containing protein [Sinomicrobium oceani]SFW73455.1 Isopentenyldiphosphate isomerase [Sinomicrobium oceani]
MDEYVDILDDQGNYTGKVLLKSEVHAKGLFHPTIHVWLFTGKDEVVLQKRSSLKDIFPGHWDVSVAGHIAAGEAPLQSAIRETREELGLEVSPDELQKIGTYTTVKQHRPTIVDRELHHIYICRLTSSPERLILQESEVEAVKLMKINDFLHAIRIPDASDAYVCHPEDYYKPVFDAIRQKNS